MFVKYLKQQAWIVIHCLSVETIETKSHMAGLNSAEAQIYSASGELRHGDVGTQLDANDILPLKKCPIGNRKFVPTGLLLD